MYNVVEYSLAACGHVGVATRASGVLFVTRRARAVAACACRLSQSSVIRRQRQTCLSLSVLACVLFSRLAGGYSR